MVTSKQIQDLLDQGYTVYSGAMGRVGKVLKTINGLVCIKLNRGSGCTVFTSGDPVELVVDSEKKEAKIVNPEWALKQAFGE